MKAIKITTKTIQTALEVTYRERDINNAQRDMRMAGVHEWTYKNYPEKYTDEQIEVGNAWTKAKENYEEALEKFNSIPEIQKLATALNEVQSKAKVRTVTTMDIVTYLNDLTNELDIPKSRMDGISVWADPNAQSFPRAYKYTPESTQFRAEYNGCWRIASVCRERCDSTYRALKLTDSAKNAIIARIERVTR